MPRKKRSQQAKPKQIEQFTPMQEAEAVTWTTYEQPRFWCPLCGMVADTDRLTQAPHDLHMALQRYGGSLPGRNAKGKKNGYMQYFDLPPEDAEYLAAQMIPIVEDVLSYLRDLAGENEGEVEALQPKPKRPKYKREPESEPEIDWTAALDTPREVEIATYPGSLVRIVELYDKDGNFETIAVDDGGEMVPFDDPESAAMFAEHLFNRRNRKVPQLPASGAEAEDQKRLLGQARKKLQSYRDKRQLPPAEQPKGLPAPSKPRLSAPKPPKR